MGVIRDTCSFFRSIYDGSKMLKPAERLEIYESIFEYMFYEKEPESDKVRPTTYLAFYSNKIAFDNAKNRYDKQKECGEYGKLGAEYGKLGGRGKKKTPENPQGGLSETPENPQEKEIEIEEEINIYTPPAHMRTYTSEYFEGVKSLCKKHCVVVYNRHMKKSNADYELGLIIDEVSCLYSLEDLEEVFKHLSKTYFVKPRMQACDLCWVMNNIDKVKKTPKELEQASGGGFINPVLGAKDVTKKSADELLKEFTFVSADEI